MKFCNFGNLLTWLLLVVGLVPANAFVVRTPTTSSPAFSRRRRRRRTTPTITRTTTRTTTKLRMPDEKPSEEDVNRWLAGYGESKFRKYRRTVFTAEDWVRSRRPERFIDNLRTTFASGLFRELALEFQVLTAASTFVVVWNDLFLEGYEYAGVHYDRLFSDMDRFLPALELPLAPFSLSITALGLLLTFRTNVSYARWNEARTAWGEVINDSRSIMRMACIWAKSYPREVDATTSDDQLQRLGDAVCSFSRTLMNRTLPTLEDEEDFKLYLTTRLIDQNYAVRLRDAKHRPTAALAEITTILVELQLNPLHQVEVEKVVTGLCDALGASERIFTSPVPTFYTRHTARFLAIWLLTLPVGLYEPMKLTWNHWGVIPVTVILGGFLLGIEELATQMEEPFSILPMEQMCEESIRTPVMEQVQRSSSRRSRPSSGTAVLPVTVTATPATKTVSTPDDVVAVSSTLEDM